MSRDVSVTARAALYAPQTAEVFLHLLTIDHDDMPSPVRLVDNLTNVTSRSNTYTAFPFRALLPVDADGELPAVDLVIDNVSQLLVETVRSISTPASVTLEVVLASDPDTVEVGPFAMEIVSVEYSAEEIHLRMTAEQLLVEPYPVGLFNPIDWPLLFQAVAT